MKKTHLNLLLGGFILVIYGYLYTIVFPEDKAITEIQLDTRETGVTTKKAIYSFEAHWVDPFRSKRLPPPKKEEPPEPAPPPVAIKPQIYLPQFTVEGKSVRNQQIQLSIRFQNQLYFISEGEKINEMTFKEILDQKMNILYKDSLFTKNY